jgi:hypothetical protein
MLVPVTVVYLCISLCFLLFAVYFFRAAARADHWREYASGNSRGARVARVYNRVRQATTGRITRIYQTKDPRKRN